MAPDLCTHLRPLRPPPPQAGTCQTCGLDGPIRTCLTCGRVGCCDSTNGHATAHHRATDHPGIRRLPLGPRSWTWCYACNDYVG